MTTYYGATTSDAIEGPFLNVARRYSLCDEAAWEALARGFEIAIRHRERIHPETAAAWFATVVRHEAMRIRRSRCRDLHLDPSVDMGPLPDDRPRVPRPRAPRVRRCPGRPAQRVRVLVRWQGVGPRNVLVRPVDGGPPYVRPFRGLRRPT
jgi:hypothetical protein